MKPSPSLSAVSLPVIVGTPLSRIEYALSSID